MTASFITMFTRAHHLSINYALSIQTTLIASHSILFQYSPRSYERYHSTKTLYAPALFPIIPHAPTISFSPILSP